MRRLSALVAALAIVVGACGGEAGVLLPACEVSVRNPTGATILATQSVPTADYTPCINALPLGWDTVDFDAEMGEARIEIGRVGGNFLTASVTDSCSTEGATEVDGPNPDIRRFERIEFTDAAIGVTIVPSANRPLLWARIIAEDLVGEEVEDRPLVITIADNIEDSVSSRVNLARLRGDFVWIVDELDAEERTLEMRGGPTASGRGISVDDALDLIDDAVRDVFYRGQWFFTFNGGCITFDFDAKHRVAQTIAVDAEAAIGFYPAYELRDMAEDMGFDIVP